MSHLTEDEIVDYVERRLTGAPLAHAGRCAACRDAADDVRAALALVADTPAPEPSPLFWEHFRARVADAIDEEPAPAAQPWWRGALAYGASAAVAAVVIGALALGRFGATPEPPADETRSAAVAPDAGDAGLLGNDDDLDADAAWAVVRTAAEGMDFDDARAAGLQVQPGAADRMALELTEAERIELVRLVEHEMKRSGA